MIDGFALNSSNIPAKHVSLLNEVAEMVKALRFFNDGGMVFLWGESDLSGETSFNDTLGRKAGGSRGGFYADCRIAGVPSAAIQRFPWVRHSHRDRRGRMRAAGECKYAFRSRLPSNPRSRSRL